MSDSAPVRNKISTKSSTKISKAKNLLTGGVHMPDQKSQSNQASIQTCPLPEQIRLPVSMHAGTDAEVIVSVGDKVQKYQCLAKATSAVSANIHSPVDGCVVEIEMQKVANRSGLEEMVIVLKVDSEQITKKCLTPDSAPNSDLTPDSTPINKSTLTPILIHDAGIVGLGGAGFPTALKLKSSAHCHTLLLNGAECEPYISCDDRTMVEYADEVIFGAAIIAKSLGCQTVQVAIEENKPVAISAMHQAAESFKPSSSELADNEFEIYADKNLHFEIISLPAIYPSGGEKQLIEIITGKQVPHGHFPASLGYVVQNIGTALAVHDAIVLKQPLINRIVTVTGDAVTKPGNYRVSLGTPIRHLLKFAGWDESKTQILIHGGPMMGFPLASADVPVVKSTNCIIAGTTEEFPEPDEERACIRCGDCADVCPASLLPQQLYWFSRSGELAKAENHHIMDCIECGACSYVCPSQIPLVDYYRFTKSEIHTRSAITEKAERSKQRFDTRNLRLENIKLEKARAREERAKLAEQKRQAKGAESNNGNNTANNTANNNDGKKDAVAEALARVQAKKQAKAALAKKTEQAAKNQNNQGNDDV